MINMNKKVKKLVKSVYERSNGLTEEYGQSVKVGDTILTLSVCPRHRTEANTIEYLTDIELQMFYDNYSLKQIAEMVEADSYPLKVISTYEQDGVISIGTELDDNGDINVSTTLEELYEVYGNEFKHYTNEMEED